MVKEVIATGETVEEAFEAACKDLGVESHEAEFEILEMPVKKTFGLFGGSPARVKAFIKFSPAQAAENYLKTIVASMGLTDVQFDVKEEEDGAMISLSGDDIGFIIGHRGETLDALQYLSGLVANHTQNTYYRITLDIGNYRDKRKDTLEVLGKKMAAKALKTGRNCVLEPMNPYERRIIHTAVQGVEGAKSWSEGADLNRHVVIGPEAGERPQYRKPYGAKGGRRPPYQGNNNRPRGDFNRDSRPPRRNNPQQQTRTPSRAPAASGAPVQKAPLYGKIEPKKPE